MYCLIYILSRRMKSNQMRENHWFTATPREVVQSQKGIIPEILVHMHLSMFLNFFSYWHESSSLSRLPGFTHCDGSICRDPMTLLKHLHFRWHDYYYRIVMRQDQNLYSSLIAKLKISDWDSKHSFNSTTFTLQSIPKGKVSLPVYVFSNSKYETINVER